MKFEDPQDLLNEANQGMGQIQPAELFNNPKYRNLFEKWAGAKFGIGYSRHVSPCLILINNDQQDSADYFLKRNEEVFRFQNVEVLVEGRRRGEEYRKGIPVWNPVTSRVRIKQSLDWVFDAINKKVAKHYSDAQQLNLSVYLDFHVNQFDHSDLIASLHPFKDKFASIWCFSHLHICSIFSNPELREINGWREIHSTITADL